MAEYDLSGLRRWPDVEADNLVAADAADRLLLDTAADRLASSAAGEVAVVGDNYGALTLGALQLGTRAVAVHQDSYTGAKALASNAQRLGAGGGYHPAALTAVFTPGTVHVLLRLPRSLDALEELAWHIAKNASPYVLVHAGGMVKHMTPAMNQVLGRHFGSVTAGLARQKARVLTLAGPLPAGPSRFPLTAVHDVGLPQPLRLCAFGTTFGGARIDPGTRFLLPQLAGARPAATAIDLGCGNGTIAAYLALEQPRLSVLAVDDSASAVASTRATVEANGLGGRVRTVQDDGLGSQPADSSSLIVLNPPFHIGAAVHTGVAFKLFEDAGRVLEPSGELWTVWNSHLKYRAALERLVGPTRQIARNPKFTVTVSTRRADGG